MRVLHNNPEMPAGTIAARTIRNDFVLEPTNLTLGIFELGTNTRKRLE
jgi:hypothetical protein